MLHLTYNSIDALNRQIFSWFGCSNMKRENIDIIFLLYLAGAVIVYGYELRIEFSRSY